MNRTRLAAHLPSCSSSTMRFAFSSITLSFSLIISRRRDMSCSTARFSSSAASLVRKWSATAWPVRDNGSTRVNWEVSSLIRASCATTGQWVLHVIKSLILLARSSYCICSCSRTCSGSVLRTWKSSSNCFDSVSRWISSWNLCE